MARAGGQAHLEWQVIVESHIAFVIGLILLFWAAPLARRYNAWASFREHNPQINPPPTAEWRRRNSIIFTWILRLLGLSLVVMDGLVLLGYYASGRK